MDFSTFCQEVRLLTGLDLCRYRSQQIERRLSGFLARYQVGDYASCLDLLRGDASRREEFVEWVTIGVSEFFRNPDRFEELRRAHLPALLRASHGALRVWSAGCADGPEAYSLAILLEEAEAGGLHRVLATDVDRSGLERAQAGVYPEEVLRQVPPEWRSRYFRRQGDVWEVVPRLRNQVNFQFHDLLAPVYPRGQHLVLCRNVLIYFEDETKLAVLRGLREALLPGGLLFLGATEMIRDARELGLRYLSPCFYRREG